MLCLRCSRGLNVASKFLIPQRMTQNVTSGVVGKRTFTSLPSLRPTIFPSTFRPSLPASTPSTLPTITAETPLDLLPKISSHPALEALQIRCGPRNTYNPSHFKRKRRHGFLSRIRTRKGRATLQRRRLKGRSTLSH